MALIIQNKISATLQNIESLFHFQMPMDGNPSARHYLLGSKRKMVGAVRGAQLNENVAAIAKMNQVLAFVGAKHVHATRRALNLHASGRQRLTDTEAAQAKKEGPAFQV